MKKAAIIFSSLGIFLFLATPAFADMPFSCAGGYVWQPYVFTGNEASGNNISVGNDVNPGDLGSELICYDIRLNGSPLSHTQSSHLALNLNEGGDTIIAPGLQDQAYFDNGVDPEYYPVVEERWITLYYAHYFTDHTWYFDYITGDSLADDTYTFSLLDSDNNEWEGIFNLPTSAPTNNPPQINSLNGGTINEDDTYSENGSFTDPDSTSWAATVDYGDGSGAQSLTLNSDNTFSLSHVYQDNGTYAVTVNITDNQGATGTATATVTVNNVAPSVGSEIPLTATINSATSFTGNFTDPGVLDTHTAQWNWGDGNTLTGTITESNGSGSVFNSHKYTALGSYTAILTVTDKDGASGNSQAVISVIPTSGLPGGNLSHANYSGANLSNQDISKANLSVGTFNNVDFQSANLSQVNGSNSSFTDDNFTGANLNKVNFSNSNLSGSNFTNVILTQGNFSGATITGVTWSNTTCPNGTNSNNDGGTCIGQGGGL